MPFYFAFDKLSIFFLYIPRSWKKGLEETALQGLGTQSLWRFKEIGGRRRRWTPEREGNESVDRGNEFPEGVPNGLYRSV